MGAVLARSEIDYHVLSLPDRLLLLVGDFSDERCANFADRVHAEVPGADGRSRVICLARSEVLDDRARVNEIIDRFKNDAFEVVRRDGPRRCCGRASADMKASVNIPMSSMYSIEPFYWIQAMIRVTTNSPG